MTKKQYNIKISKYFDKETDATVLEMSLSKELTDLLKKFIVTDENDNMRRTSWAKKAAVDDDDTTEYVYRYLVRGILKSSVSGRWSDVYDLLFTPDVINNQKIKVPLMSIRMFTDVQNTIVQIKDLISTMEKINTDKEYNVTIKVE